MCVDAPGNSSQLLLPSPCIPDGSRIMHAAMQRPCAHLAKCWRGAKGREGLGRGCPEACMQHGGCVAEQEVGNRAASHSQID